MLERVLRVTVGTPEQNNRIPGSARQRSAKGSEAMKNPASSPNRARRIETDIQVELADA